MQAEPTTTPSTTAPRLEVVPAPIIVKGWRLDVSTDGRGDHHVVLRPYLSVDGTPPEAEEFAGYQYRDVAVRDASAWCDAHPLRVDGESPGGFAWWASWYGGESAQGYRFTVIHAMQVRGALIEGVHVFGTAEECCAAAEAWCEAYKPGEALPPEVPAAAPAAEGADGGAEGAEALDAVVAEQLAAEADAAVAECSAAAPAQSVYDERVDEVWTLLQQRGEARARRVKVRSALELAKAQLKAIELELEELDAQVETAVANGPRQRMLPLTPAPRMEQAKVAEQAPAVVADLKHQGPEVPWAFNGVDHTIVVREHRPDGKSALGWRAYLKGHEDKTEAFDPERPGAIESCKLRASIVFEDAEPGSTAIPTPPRRGRKKKAAEEPTIAESPDAPRVIAALRSAMNIGEAAKTLKRSEKTLQKWCAENGVTISEHLARDIGQDEPAPKASKRGRGRKAK